MSTPRMFRQEALDELRSPEDLNQLLTVVGRRAWITVAALGVFCAAGLAWSVLGKIPVTVDGVGVLVNAGQIRGIQASASGQITELPFRTGQRIRKGDVIAILNQEQLQTDFRQEKERLQELNIRFEIERRIAQQRAEVDARAAREQQRLIEVEIAGSEALAAKAKDRQETFLTEQLQGVSQTRELMQKLFTARQGQVETIKALRKEGLTSDDLVLDAETNLTSSQLQIADLNLEQQRLEMRRLETEQDELRNQSRLGDLRVKLLELSMQELRAQQDAEHQELTRKAELEEAQRRVSRLQFLLERSTQLVSEFDGRILELTVAPGQLIDEGTRLGTIELEDPQATLENIAYFSIKDGKRISQGDLVYLTPSTVQRERYGSIVGRVTRVSAFPVTAEGATRVLGSAEVAESLMQRGGAIEVETELLTDTNSPSGYRWTSQGPPIRFSAGTTTTTRVVLEYRVPISYIFPILRAWVFGEKDETMPSQ